MTIQFTHSLHPFSRLSDFHTAAFKAIRFSYMRQNKKPNGHPLNLFSFHRRASCSKHSLCHRRVIVIIASVIASMRQFRDSAEIDEHKYRKKKWLGGALNKSVCSTLNNVQLWRPSYIPKRFEDLFEWLTIRLIRTDIWTAVEEGSNNKGKKCCHALTRHTHTQINRHKIIKFVCVNWMLSRFVSSPIKTAQQGRIG